MIKYSICETCSRRIYSRDELCWSCLGWDESWASFAKDPNKGPSISVFQFLEFTLKCVLGSFIMMIGVGTLLELFSLPVYGLAIGIILIVAFIHLVFKDYYGPFYKRLLFFSIEFLKYFFCYDDFLKMTKKFIHYIRKTF